MEFQEGKTPKKERQVPKGLLETAYKAFLSNRESWRKELIFARDFPNNRLNQLVIFLNQAISAGWPVFVVDETKGESEIGIIGLEHDESYGIYSPNDFSKVKNSFIYRGPSRISLRHTGLADTIYTLKRKAFIPKEGDFKENVQKTYYEAQKDHSILLDIRCGGRLRRRVITDLESLGRPGKIWIVGFDPTNHQFFPVLGNSEGEWGIKKELSFQEL